MVSLGASSKLNLWLWFVGISSSTICGYDAIPTDAREEKCSPDAATSADDDGVEKSCVREECTLWLAESSIVGAGLGMYTGKQVQKGERVGEPDIVIPIIDPDKRNWNPLHEFTWNGDVLHDLFFENSFIVDALIPGLGAQANCHMGLNNLDLGTDRADNAGLHRSRDPAVGSFSPRYHYAKVADRDIVPGEELFISYGEQWFLDREYMLGTIPFEEEYQISDSIGAKILPHIDTFPEELWDVIYQHAEPRLQDALPKNFNDYKDIAHSYNGSTARASCPNSIRSLSWLRQYGYCVDQLYAATSTIAEAGRGAFSKRSFRKDDVIIVSPVIHFPVSFIPIQDQFRSKDGEHYYTNNITRKEKQQLLLNYAFGHENSNVLLVAYGSVVNFINHHSSPNAYIRWASSSKHHKDKLLHLTAEEVLQEKHGLMIEYVALRDIAAHEEIFLDYGESWVKGWREHLEQFQPNSSLEYEQYISAAEYRTLYPNEPIRTVKEQQTNPYPPNLQTSCFYCTFGEPSDLQSVSSMLVDDLGTVDVRTVWNSTVHDFGCLLPCSILSRSFVNASRSNSFQPKPDDYYYTALISPLDNEFLPASHIMVEDERHIVYHIPMSKVKIVDKEYTTDIHIPNAFRHHINVPDGMYPDLWLHGTIP